MPANAGPLGLAAFGLTTTLLNLKNVRLLSGGSTSMILAMGMVFGGAAQLVAGTMEFLHGNTFACVAFTSYGAFWLSFVVINLLPLAGVPPCDGGSIAAYLAMWGLFTLGMFCGTVKIKAHRCLQALFFLLTILFALLASGEAIVTLGAKTFGEAVGIIAGAEGLVVGLLAIYIAFAEVNGWPLFPVQPPLQPLMEIPLSAAGTPTIRRTTDTDSHEDQAASYIDEHSE
eukprot:TRINITY_DN313_c0_g2_i4.p1 TRINITY_DN313_c0_g2~~TRINITY_DN313_c0_g2_i4.p1  ORF type:complete len:229 (+),score=57.77 TRINITY_DN313_c0_g2_i4:1088-1774(+)